MKKFITGIAVACFLVLGMNTVAAQSLSTNSQSPEVVAKQKVAELSEDLGLSGDQQRSLFRAYVQKEVNYDKHVTGKDQKSAAVIAEKKKHDDQLAAAVKRVLTPEQYKKWLAMQK
ncbi:hypothetical protein [Marinirhabdus gelatinilytica]|uniref:LTXXQ motif family protein n=1 Tax=Marinirhabdus gelatinilytica TaxID=1703343 RepID=A0A370Q7I9_9FLAO|nr:hypothetical protein [Marinirhabdus gelatinilytica]RDK84335.1 hypothetical protein C8D94_105181 [Marinirhabdus gelatinilytica]